MMRSRWVDSAARTLGRAGVRRRAGVVAMRRAAAASPARGHRVLSVAARFAASNRVRAAATARPAPLHVAVCGCGPAGLASALLLHGDGHRVTMYERFQTARPVGSGLLLQPTGLAVLRQLGLDVRARALGARIDRLHGELSNGRVVLDVGYSALRSVGAWHDGSQPLHGVGIHRAALFRVLYDEVRRAGIAVHTGAAVTGVRPGGVLELQRQPDDVDLATTATVTAAGEVHSVGPFDLVVDALGSRSALIPPSRSTGCGDLSYGALWATVDWPDAATADRLGFNYGLLHQRYRAASQMCGVMPIGVIPSDANAAADGSGSGGHSKPMACLFWSLKADQLDAWKRDGLDAWKRQVLALFPETYVLLEQLHDPAQLTFARYAHRTLSTPFDATTRVVHVGDSWHATSPQLGQGANMALLDAWALTKALRDTRDGAGRFDVPQAMTRAVQLRRSHVHLYQAMSRVFTPVYQSDSRVLPWLRDAVVGPASKVWPVTSVLAAMVSGLFGRPLQRLQLDTTAGAASAGTLMPPAAPPSS